MNWPLEAPITPNNNNTEEWQRNVGAIFVLVHVKSKTSHKNCK